MVDNHTISQCRLPPSKLYHKRMDVVVLNNNVSDEVEPELPLRKAVEVPKMRVVVVCLPVLMALVDLTHSKRQFSFSNNDHPEKSHLSLYLHHCCLPKTLSEVLIFFFE